MFNLITCFRDYGNVMHYFPDAYMRAFFFLFTLHALAHQKDLNLVRYGMLLFFIHTICYGIRVRKTKKILLHAWCLLFVAATEGKREAKKLINQKFIKISWWFIFKTLCALISSSFFRLGFAEMYNEQKLETGCAWMLFVYDMRVLSAPTKKR